MCPFVIYLLSLYFFEQRFVDLCRAENNPKNLIRIILLTYILLSDIAKLEKRLEFELDRQKQINEQEKINLVNKCVILEEYQQKAEMELECRQKEISNLLEEIKTLTLKTQQIINDKDKVIVQVKEEKDAMINILNEQLNKEKQNLDSIKIVLDSKQAEVLSLKNELDQKIQEDNIVKILRKENEELIKLIGQRETCKFL